MKLRLTFSKSITIRSTIIKRMPKKKLLPTINKIRLLILKKRLQKKRPQKKKSLLLTPIKLQRKRNPQSLLKKGSQRSSKKISRKRIRKSRTTLQRPLKIRLQQLLRRRVN